SHSCALFPEHRKVVAPRWTRLPTEYRLWPGRACDSKTRFPARPPGGPENRKPRRSLPARDRTRESAKATTGYIDASGSILNLHMALKQIEQIIQVNFGIGLKLQGVMGAGILDDFLVERGKPFDEPARPNIVNDAVLLCQHHEDGNLNITRRQVK